MTEKKVEPNDETSGEGERILMVTLKEHVATDLGTALINTLSAGQQEYVTVTIKWQTAVELYNSLMSMGGVSEQAGDSYTESD